MRNSLPNNARLAIRAIEDELAELHACDELDLPPGNTKRLTATQRLGEAREALTASVVRAVRRERSSAPAPRD